MGWIHRLLGRKPVPPSVAGGAELPEESIAVLRDCVPLWRIIPRALLPRLHQLTAQFIAEKEFWGSPDQPVTPEMKLIVASQACILILNLPRLGLFPQMNEVVIRPDEFGGVFDAIGPDGRTYPIDRSRIGEASHRGPVLLSWKFVKKSAAAPLNGRNVVLHEFAHVLDYMDGDANGAPVLEDASQYDPWSKVLASEYQALMAAASRGRRTLLDPYGAESPAEFFAVATEHFFEQGARLKRSHPALYAQLKRFYQQDPAQWWG